MDAITIMQILGLGIFLSGCLYAIYQFQKQDKEYNWLGSDKK